MTMTEFKSKSGTHSMGFKVKAPERVVREAPQGFGPPYVGDNSRSFNATLQPRSKSVLNAPQSQKNALLNKAYIQHYNPDFGPEENNVLNKGDRDAVYT